MARYVALLRGVNVGRANRVPMAAFRDLLEQSGCSGVRTLLNSGNAVFASPDRSPPALADRIRAALAQQLAVDVPVIVKSRKDLAAVVAGNGIARVATDPSRLLVAFTQDAKALADLEALSRLCTPPSDSSSATMPRTCGVPTGCSRARRPRRSWAGPAMRPRPATGRRS